MTIINLDFGIILALIYVSSSLANELSRFIETKYSTAPNCFTFFLKK